MSSTTQKHHEPHGDASECGPGSPSYHDDVAQLAYSYYQMRGSHDGHDMRDWFEAEAHIKARHIADKHAHHHSNASASASSR